MTAVNCILRPHFVAVATDSVATDMVDWGPALMLPKAEFLPTARILFAATGSVLLIQAARVAAIRAACLCVEDLRPVLPVILRQAHQYMLDQVRALHPHEDDAWQDGGRFYAFAWSDAAGRFVGDCYSAAEDWLPEELADGIEANPRVWHDGSEETHPLARIRSPLHLCDLVHAQWEAEQAEPIEDRNLIGGAVMLYTLTRHESVDDGGDPVAMQVRQMGALPGWPGLLATIRSKASAGGRADL